MTVEDKHDIPTFPGEDLAPGNDLLAAIPNHNNSCALDSALSSVCALALSLGRDKWLLLGGCGLRSTAQAAHLVFQWAETIRWEWSRATPGQLRALRDKVKFMLSDTEFVSFPLTININSPIDQVVELILPPDLFTIIISLRDSCLCGETRHKARSRSGIWVRIQDAGEIRHLAKLIESKVKGCRASI